MVETVHRRPRVVRRHRAAPARTRLRPARPGPAPRRPPLRGDGLRPGLEGRALRGDDRHPRHRRLGRDRGGPRPARGLPCPAPGGRDAARHRAGVQRVRRRPLPRILRGSAPDVQLPRLGRPLQARSRGPLPPGRGLRRRPVPHPRLERPHQGGTAHRPATPPRHTGSRAAGRDPVDREGLLDAARGPGPSQGTSGGTRGTAGPVAPAPGPATRQDPPKGSRGRAGPALRQAGRVTASSSGSSCSSRI